MTATGTEIKTSAEKVCEALENNYLLTLHGAIRVQTDINGEWYIQAVTDEMLAKGQR